MNPLTLKSWSPYGVGAAIGLLSTFAFVSADQPLGVSTAFETTAALMQKAISPEAEGVNEYFLAKNAEGKPPKIGWEWMVVVGLFIGAYLSSRASDDRPTGTVPPLWRWRFGQSPALRLAVAFIAGAAMMFGARLAQGCTSGHGISGSLQLAASSWLFTVVFFIVAIATAFVMYGKEGADHV